MPELFRQLASMTFGKAWDLTDLAAQIDCIYRAIGSQSIDYGVMEKSERVQMLPAAIGWSDVGSWSALPEVSEADAQGNVVVNCSAYVNVDSSGCIVSGNGGAVATVGVKDLIVVATTDALLVCPVERAQDVRHVVDQLAAQGLNRYL
jgi:mannose-1-phosphate guanylyltransferase